MKNLLFLFALLACFTACSDGNDSNDDNRGAAIAFVDITDATALYITSSSSDSEEGVKTRAESETITNSLFKIIASGETVEVQFSSADGENVDQLHVSFIKDLSEKYIYMSYFVKIADREDWEHTQVLVKKDDGAVFKLPMIHFYGHIPTYDDSYKDYELINENREFQVDYNGNVYVYYDGYPNEWYCKIIKIYTHSNEVFLTPINRDDMELNGSWNWNRYKYLWLVDQQGNAIINGTYTRLATGEFTRSPEMNGGEIFTVYGDSEGFYRLNREDVDENGYQNWIQYCQAEAPAMVWKNHQQFFENKRIDDYYRYYRVFSYKDKTIVIVKPYDTNNSSAIKLTIYNRNKIEEELLEDCCLLDEDYEYYGNMHPCTEKYVYKFTDQQIWRAEIETGKAELLYDYGKEYVIKSIKVKNNIVTCDAFELRRGNDVVMEIYEDKSVHLVESVNNDKIIYLERLN